MKMRVCVDARLIQQAGIGTFLKSSLTILKQTETYEIILLGYEKDKALLKDYSSQLIEMQSSIYSVAEQWEYSHKIPPCVLFLSPHYNIPLGPIRAKQRLACIYDVYHLAHFSTLTFSQKIYAKIMYNAAFFLSHGVITLSDFSRNEILRFATFKPSKIHVVAPPLDFCATEGRIEKKHFILSVGNLKPHKNLVRLVKAYAQLRPKEALYIVGRKEGLKTVDRQLFQEVEKNHFLKQNVHFIGVVTEEKLKELYREAQLFVFPSTYEGFGYTPLEAMASECPVVASKIASIPEVCGDAVEYIDPFSIDSIAEGMNRVLSDPNRRDELIQKGKRLIAEKKSRKNALMDVIDACCNSS